MLEADSHARLKEQIRARVVEDRAVLDQLRDEIRPLRTAVRRILPRTTTAVSVVGTDGGSNSIPFDPFLIQLIRVVDSSNNEYCLEVISPTMSVAEITRRQFDADGVPMTALGEMMSYLGVADLPRLTPMIHPDADGKPRNPSWVEVYRELVEWAILFGIVRTKDFGTDTILIFDGLLRSKVFAGDLFKRYLDGIREGIERQEKRNKRKPYLAGVAKQSKVLARYRLAMALEGILTSEYAAYVDTPRVIEEKAYVRSEYARGDAWEPQDAALNKFVGGKMFFVKFGNRPRDPVWPIDIFIPQEREAPAILGCMLADALSGFPVPHYPRCLQRAHENAALVDFDFTVLQDQVFVENLVSRRTFVFARAGFGKSNLVKLLFSKLYETTPVVAKRAGRMAPVGTVIFDPDGEYFWPDDKGRPGLADVPALKDQLVVFTPRRNPSNYYQSFVAGGIKLDIRRLRPSDVIAVALAPDRQDQQNVRKLASLSIASWEGLVDLIDKHGNQADLKEVAGLLSLEKGQDLEALAARANMTYIVRSLHDKSSQMMDMLLESLSEGKLCVVDVSQMRGGTALILSGLILRRIFDRNQEEFTKADSRTIPTIAVVEEAQSVLNERASAAEPYVAWVKEGRKYDLGALLITQQPGSIPTEILSQGDNWFIFHLLSAGDLASVHRSNAHFSDDLLSVLLNEPIPGHCVFWSSVGATPYPISVRVFSFETIFAMQDPTYSRHGVDTFAARLKARYEQALSQTTTARAAHANGKPGASVSGAELFQATDETEFPHDDSPLDETLDAKAILESRAIAAFRNDAETLGRLRSERGMPWRGVMAALERHLPEATDGRSDWAYQLVRRAMNETFGSSDQGWTTYRNENNVTYVRVIR